MRGIDKLVKNSGSPFPTDFWEQCAAHDKLVDERIKKEQEAKVSETVIDQKMLQFDPPKTKSQRSVSVEAVKVARFRIPECQVEKSKLIGDTLHESIRFKP